MIESYRFGRIVIDGRSYRSDVVICLQGVCSSWRRGSSHKLVPGDLEGVLGREADTIIVGTGIMGRMQVSDATREYLESRGLDVIIERTDRACEAYNRLSQDGLVIAALHLSC